MEPIQQATKFTYAAEAATWTFWCLSTVLFGMRLFSRYRLKRTSTNLDDFIIIVAWMLAVCRQSFYQRALTLIRHVNPNDLDDTLPPATFWLLLSDYWFMISSPLPKVAIGIVLVTIFEPRKWLRFSILGSAVFLCIFGFIGFFINLFSCSPVAAQWNPEHYTNYNCWSDEATTAYVTAFAIFGGLIDFAFSIYPGVIIWKLKMPLWKKLSTAGLMGMGIVSGALCFVKLAWLFPLVDNNNPNKRLRYGAILDLFCCIENDLVVGAACLPYTRPIFHACRLYLKKYFKIMGSRLSMSPSSTKDDIMAEKMMQ